MKSSHWLYRVIESLSDLRTFCGLPSLVSILTCNHVTDIIESQPGLLRIRSHRRQIDRKLLSCLLQMLDGQ